MWTDQIGRAYRAADSLPGGPGVREFAACEFPREELSWVVSQTRRPRTLRVGGRWSWGRLRRAFGTPEESKPDNEAIVDSATA